MKAIPRKSILRLRTLLLSVIIAAEFIPGAALAADERNITQNWAGAAVFYDAPCDETETFHMTEEEFLRHKLDMETRLVYAYSACYSSLVGEQREALKAAQKAWLECYYAYLDSLAQRWKEPVKVYFGVTGKERRTVLYREFALLMLINRITDLEEWNAGRFASVEDALVEDKLKEAEQAKKELQLSMGLCMYVIDEPYRPKIRASNRKFYAFLDSNSQFISLMTDGDQKRMIAEELLQVQRMKYLTDTHQEGCRFFRREREE